jgi:hypothetical protein
MKDHILVPREYEGERCGTQCAGYSYCTDYCCAFSQPIHGCGKPYAVRCPACLSAPAAVVLTEEMRGVLLGVVGIMETCGMHGPLPAIRAAFPTIFEVKP